MGGANRVAGAAAPPRALHPALRLPPSGQDDDAVCPLMVFNSCEANLIFV